MSVAGVRSASMPCTLGPLHRCSTVRHSACGRREDHALPTSAGFKELSLKLSLAGDCCGIPILPRRSYTPIADVRWLGRN